MRRTLLVPVGVVIGSAAVLAAGEGDRRPVVRALLDRSRLLEDVRFTVPVSAYREYLREQRAAAGPSVPAPVARIAEEGRYRLTIDREGKAAVAASVSFRVFQPRRCRGMSALTGGWAWEGIAVDGKPADLAARKGWFQFSPARPGRYVVSGRRALGSARPEGGRLTFRVARTALTVVEFHSPAPWEVRARGTGIVLRGKEGVGTHGVLALAPRDRVDLRYARPVALPPRPPRYELRGVTAWNLDAGCQQVAARIYVRILGEKTDRLHLRLPQGARRASVTGPDVREVQGPLPAAAVFLRGRLGGQTRLDVTYELPVGKGSVKRLERIQVQNGHWAAGTLVVTNTAGGSEVLAHSIAGLREIHPARLPTEARRMLAGEPVLAYEITSRRFSVAVDMVDLAEYALRESIADLAHYQLLFRDDGSILCRADYEIRNRGRQFLRVSLPRRARIVMARVNDRPAPPTRVPAERDAYLLPLVRSQASVKGLVSFPVLVVFLCRAEPLGRRGEAQIPLPRIDLPIAYGWCELHVPPGMAVSRWAGPLRRVQQYSSETAVASLTYGRGELAAGYQLSDRPTARAEPESGRRPTGQAAPQTAGGLTFRPGQPAPVAAPPLLPTTRPAQGGTDLQTAVTAPQGGTIVLGGQTLLGRNYYRAGRDYYERADYDDAMAALKKAIELAPRSADAANAGRLLANIKAVRGQLEASSREEKALSRQVKREVSSPNVAISARQHRLIQQGREALRGGRYDAARTQYEAAQSLGRQLLAQGADVGEQSVRLGEVGKQLAKLRERERDEAVKLRLHYEALKGGQRYGEALKVGKKLREITTGDQAAFTAELEDLAVKEVRKLASGEAQTWEVQVPDRADRPGDAARATPGALARVPQLVPMVHGRASEAAGPSRGPLTPRPERRADPDEMTTTVKRAYDVRDLLAGTRGAGWDTGGGKALTDSKREAKNVLGTVRSALGNQLAEGTTPLRVVDGQLVVDATAGGQKQVRELLGRLRDVRGPQVQVGERIARQRAGALAGESVDLDAGDVLRDPSGAAALAAEYGIEKEEAVTRRRRRLAARPEYQDFVKRNYAWQISTGRPADKRRRRDDGRLSRSSRAGHDLGSVTTDVPRAAPILVKIPAHGSLFGKDTPLELSGKLFQNLGQKVGVNSVNVSLNAAIANGLGITFTAGANGTRFAVIDEAQLRTLRDVEARGEPVGAAVRPGPRFQETIVGTDALLANGETANVVFAGDAGNTLDVNGNTIALPHAKYVLLDNGSYLTAVQAGEMQHWTERARPVAFADIPQEIGVPHVGRLVKLEKTLIRPTDRLTIRATYTWKDQL